MQLRHAVLFVFFAAITACNATKVQPVGSDLAASSTIAPITCSSGDLTTFTFGELDFTPDASIVKYQASTATTAYRLAAQKPGSAPYVRFDTCVKDEDIDLKRIIFRDRPVTGDSIVPVDSGAIVNGLHDAVFLGDQSGLDIRLPVPGESNKWLFVSGWKQASGDTFATAVFGRILNNSPKPNSLEHLVGSLTVGDPLASQKCDVGLDFRTATFTLEDVKFEWDICEGYGGGETTSYKVTALRVTDSSPSLSAAAQKPQTFDSAAKVDQVLKYKWNHHNACDSFVLTLPTGVYAATTAQSAGCSPPLSGAPARSIQNDPAPGKTLFTIKRSTGPLVSSSVACGHYLFFCSGAPVTATNEFLWSYSNHQWNTWDIRVDGTSVKFTTPEGDGVTSNRNVGPGFRPKVIYNQFELLSATEDLVAAKWAPIAGTSKRIFCRTVPDLLDVATTNFPYKDWASLAGKFAIANNLVTSANTCNSSGSGLQIAKPDAKPATSIGLKYTLDIVCMVSPKALTGQGPNLITFYAPMAYTAQQTMPGLNEWPKDQAQICIDGKLSSLKRNDN